MSVIPAASRAALTGLALTVFWLAASAPALAQVSDADVYVAEAVLAIDDKQWDKALDLLRRALERSPDHVEALYYTGVAYLGKRQPGEAVKALTRANRLAPKDSSIAFQLGLAYFALDQYDRAEPLLEEVFAREPTLPSLGYYVGFLRYRKQQYQEALRAFRAGQTADPTIADLTRLYTGLALQRLGLSAQTEAEIAQIGKLRPAAPLTGPAERVQSAPSAPRETARRFRAELRAGAFYDDNVPAVPEAKPNDPSVVSLRDGVRDSFGELLSIRLEYDWLQTQAWLGTVAFSFFGTHNNSLPSFDIQDYTGSLNLARRGEVFGLPFLAGASYTYDYLVLDNDELVQRHAAAAYAVLVESARHLTNVQARVEVKEYSEIRPLPADEFLDAVNYLVGFQHIVRFSRDRHLIKAGYQFDYDDTRGRNFAYYGHRFLAGAQYTLGWRDIRLSYDFDLHYRDYLHTNTSLPLGREGSRERSDREYTHTARVQVPLPWFTRDQALFLTGEYIGKTVDSNIAVFAYTRNFGAIYFTWQY